MQEQRLNIWVQHTTLCRASSPARRRCQGRPWHAGTVGTRTKGKSTLFCSPGDPLPAKPLLAGVQACSPIVQGGLPCLATLTLESCTSPALWAFLGVNRIIVSRNARRCLVLIDIYSEVRAHCSFWLKAKANSCALVVCRFIRQVRLVPPRKTKPVSKMIKNGRHISK